MTNLLPNNYNEVLKDVLILIKENRAKAIKSVNTILLQTYWEIGKRIEDEKEKNKWGTKVLEKLSIDLKNEFPNERGYSVSNLKYMSLFFREFCENEIGQTVFDQLSWSNHISIITKCKTKEEKSFYRTLCIKHNWSSRELVKQIESDLCFRIVGEKDKSKIQKYLHSLKSDTLSITQAFRDEYILDFIDEDKILLEKDLEKSILTNLGKFFLEWGKGEISLLGVQYPCLISGEEHPIDLLLFHRGLNSLVVIELKSGKFKAEYTGQVNKYINWLKKNKKKDHENDPVGVILCREVDKELVDLSLEGLEDKMKVSIWSKLPSKQLILEEIQKIEKEFSQK